MRVRYADTDAMGVVYYGNYLTFFETGRVEAMRQVEMSYQDLVHGGMHLPVVEAHVRYRQVARFDDLLLVDAWVAERTGARFRFDYEVRREADGALVATGSTIHACVNAESLRPMRIPARVASALDVLARPANAQSEG